MPPHVTTVLPNSLAVAPYRADPHVGHATATPLPPSLSSSSASGESASFLPKAVVVIVGARDAEEAAQERRTFGPSNGFGRQVRRRGDVRCALNLEVIDYRCEGHGQPRLGTADVDAVVLEECCCCESRMMCLKLMLKD